LFRLVGIFSLFCLLCLMAVPAGAFAPDDVELQNQLQKRYGALSSWEAEMTFPEHPGVSVHLWYARGKWRQEWSAGDKAVAVGRNTNVVGKCTNEEFARSPLFIWMVPNPVATWRSWGADNATRSFGFCDSDPCLTFGAEPGDATVTAVQIHNEDMSPILIRYMAGETLTSVRYGDYRTFGGFRVPQSVQVTIGADQVLDAKVKWIRMNRADGEELYARESLDGMPCAAPPHPFDFLRDSFLYPQAK